MIAILIVAFAVLVGVVWLCLAFSQPKDIRVRRDADAGATDRAPEGTSDPAAKTSAGEQSKQTTTAVAAWWWLNHHRGPGDDSPKEDRST